MIIILMTTIVLLSIMIFYMNVNFYKQKKIFRIKIETLEQVIVDISREQLLQSNQLKISDEFNEHFKDRKTVLGSNVFNLNHELFEILSKNDLLKK